MITSLHDSALVPISSSYCVIGTGDATKKDEFSEKFQTAFDPPLFGPFPKIHPFWQRHPSLSCFDVDETDHYAQSNSLEQFRYLCSGESCPSDMIFTLLTL